MKFHKIHDFCGFSGAVPPRPRAVGEQTRKLRIPSAPPHGRAGGNPAPSRRESGPEPTEIPPRADRNPAPTPIPSPPLNTYLTLFPFGSDAAHPPSLQHDSEGAFPLGKQLLEHRLMHMRNFSRLT